jgi:hypothetical protein
MGEIQKRKISRIWYLRKTKFMSDQSPVHILAEEKTRCFVVSVSLFLICFHILFCIFQLAKFLCSQIYSLTALYAVFLFFVEISVLKKPSITDNLGQVFFIPDYWPVRRWRPEQPLKETTRWIQSWDQNRSFIGLTLWTGGGRDDRMKKTVLVVSHVACFITQRKASVSILHSSVCLCTGIIHASENGFLMKSDIRCFSWKWYLSNQDYYFIWRPEWNSQNFH